MRWIVLIALTLMGCGDRNQTPDPKPVDAARPVDAAAPVGALCETDVHCVGDWRPNRPGCGSTDRCFGGHCITPPTTTGEANAETGRLVFEIDGADKAFQLEVVSGGFATTRGMMCRRSMQPDWGMLFLMTQTRVQSFWMFNTLISLDLVFLDEQWKVVGVVEQAEPLTQSGRSVGLPSRYVLELKGGEASRAGIKAGQTARFYPPRGE